MSDFIDSNNGDNKNTLNKKVAVSRQHVDSLIKINKKEKKQNSNNLKIEKGNIVLQKEILNEEKNNLDSEAEEIEEKNVDGNKRLFLKVAGIAGLGVAASTLIPKQASAYIAGGAPTSNIVGIKDDDNNRINPATEETLSSLLSGQGVNKLTKSLSTTGVVHTPASGKKIRVYAIRFSLTANVNSVSFRFGSGGVDYEKYVSPKTGGLYGANNHPNYIEGGSDEVLYCVIDGTTTIQVNIDYLEV